MFDIQQHNEEVRQVWETYRAGNPIRTPFILGINPRLTMFDHPANPKNITFAQYFQDPELMIERQVEHAYWVRHNIPHDIEMGLPEAWGIYIDFQNVYEAAWFGCKVEFPDGQVPATEPILDEDHKNLLFDQGVPDPFTGGYQKHAWELWDTMKEMEKSGLSYYDRPIRVGNVPGFGTDGPMTNCCNLRGAAEFCLDLAMDSEYAHQLLEYVTEATIQRIRAYRQRMGQPVVEQSFGIADDSIALLSPQMYEECILPYHRKLFDAFSQGGPNSIHLCGDATRHFPMLKRELNIKSFDTGFPVDFGALREQLGPDVEILGGPSVPFLQSATPKETLEESKRILTSGIMEGGRFILREGNNLSPEITLENVAAMYEAAKTFGRYS